MASIKDVARIAQVSIATVSRFINDPELVKPATREKVQAAITSTGYAPNTLARNFRLGKTGVVIVVLPSVGDPFFEKVMQGIMDVAASLHYSVVIRETRHNTLTADEYSNLIFSKQADGIILLASVCPFTPPTIDDIKSKQPIVLGCESVTPELSHFPSVRIDNFSASKQATELLIQLGHTKVGFITGTGNSTLTVDRERGYRDAMASANLKVGPDWIQEGGLTIAGAQEATRILLKTNNRPSAIFCANDEMALACMHEIRTQGLSVPDDISVMGFDDIRYASISQPPLSTVAQPAEEIGQRTMQRLIKAIDGCDIGSEPEIVTHQLVERGSTAQAPK